MHSALLYHHDVASVFLYAFIAKYCKMYSGFVPTLHENNQMWANMACGGTSTGVPRISGTISKR